MIWKESPQRLKNIQKLHALDPDNKSLTRMLIDQIGARYAGEDIQNELAAMRTALGQREREAQLSRGERRLAMAEDVADYNRKANKTAEILGWGNIGTSGLFGLSDLYAKKKQAQDYRDLTSTIKQLARGNT